MKITKERAQELVNNGVKLLDEKMPGWWSRIDTDRLNLATCRRCVLGQLFYEFAEEPFSFGAEALGISGLTADHGFAYPPEAFQAPQTFEEIAYNWRLLQDCWIEAIADKMFQGRQLASDIETGEEAAVLV